MSRLSRRRYLILVIAFMALASIQNSVPPVIARENVSIERRQEKGILPTLTTTIRQRIFGGKVENHALVQDEGTGQSSNEWREGKQRQYQERERFDLDQESSLENNQERFEKYALKIEARFAKYDEKLTAIHQKLQTLTNSLETKGADVSTIETQLAEAQTKREEASTLAAETVQMYRSLVDGSGEIRPSDLAAAQEKRTLTIHTYNEARQLLMQTISDVRQLKAAR